MPRLNVRDQLRIGYLAVIVVLLAPMVASVIYIGRTASVFAASVEHHDLIVQAQELSIALQYSARDANAYMLGYIELRPQYERHRQRFIAALAQLASISAFLTPEQRKLILDLDETQRRYDSAMRALFQSVDFNRATGTAASELDQDTVWQEATKLSSEMDVTITALADELRRVAARESDAIQRQIGEAAVVALVFAVGALGAAIVISQTVSGRIVPPITRLAAVARSVASGDLSLRANIKAPNEIGELGANFDLMTGKLSESIRALEAGLVEAHLAREQAERAEKIKGAFLASMSHELRTPLNAIINFTRFVADGDMGDVNTQQKNLLDEVVSSAKHLLSLINDVLDMSKIEAGALNLFVEDNVSVSDLLHNLVTISAALIAEKPLRVVTSIPDDLPTIRADRQRLYQSLLNIVANAIKFTDEGIVTIAARTADKAVEVAIADTGPGIAPEDADAVFTAFRQTDSGLKSGRGTGLGMPIAKSLIEAHGGAITLESTKGQGTTFKVTIPIKSEILTPQSAPVGRVP